jgi:hypothetical protein
MRQQRIGVHRAEFHDLHAAGVTDAPRSLRSEVDVTDVLGPFLCVRPQIQRCVWLQRAVPLMGKVATRSPSTVRKHSGVLAAATTSPAST